MLAENMENISDYPSPNAEAIANLGFAPSRLCAFR